MSNATKKHGEHAALVLDAGGVLPPGTAAGDDADALTARTYTHPVLPGRTIVRLVPATLGAAEDLAVDFLGLARDEEAGAPEVGLVRRESLGFPAWALVNDPANGHHALALVRDMERLGRMAATRPGAAKDGFAALAETLGRAVPHFLPTYCEEVARIFLARENTAQAAIWFNKAREAERIHSLDIEEDRLRAVFLEFAFAGALTAKAMREHTKALTARLGPDAAWEQVRRLAVERAAAGMPPYAGLAEDLRGLLRRTTLDRDAEERGLLAELLAGGAVARAPLSFWRAFAPALRTAAHGDPAIRARLVQITPRPSGGDAAETDDLWLDLLAATGAEALLTGPAADHPDVDAAAWLTGWAQHRKRGWRGQGRSLRTLALAGRMAARLAEAGRPVDLFGTYYRSTADLDLLDVCLAAGVPVQDPPERAEFDLGEWYKDDRDGRRDLAAVGADPRWRPLLKRAVGALGTGNSAHHLLAAADHPVLRDALREHLGDLLDHLERATTLPALRAATQALRPFREIYDLVRDDARARIGKVTADAALARTLRVGIADELGWPALEEAVARFDTKDVREGNIEVEVCWPGLVLSSASRVVVVGADDVLIEHDLPKDVRDHWRRPTFRYAGGDLLVRWWDNRGGWRAYWLSRPGEVFEPEEIAGRHYRGLLSITQEHPGGGLATGDRLLHAGDTKLPPTSSVMYDGTSWWTLDHVGDRVVWVDHDPVTGGRGRPSLPPFIARALDDGGTLETHACMLAPLPPGMENTPLGTDGRLVGVWVRRDAGFDGQAGGTITAGTVDGTTVTVPAPGRTWGHAARVPLGRLRLPGGSAPVVVATGGGVCLYDGDDEIVLIRTGRGDANEAAGTPLVPPVPLWHALRPRDEAASARLRAVTDVLAGELLTRVRAERAAAARTMQPHEAATALPLATARAVLGDDAHPALVTGLAGVLRGADRVVAGLEKLLEPVERPAITLPEYHDPRGSDARVVVALAGVADPGHGNEGQWTVIPQIRAVAGILTGAPAAPAGAATGNALATTGTPVTGAAVTGAPAAGSWTQETHQGWIEARDWTRALGRRAILVARALAVTTPNDQRETILELLDALGRGPLAAPDGVLRLVQLREGVPAREAPYRVGQILRRGARTVIILGRGPWVSGDVVQWRALDHDPTGAFGGVDGFTAHDEHPFTEFLTGDQVAAVTAGVRARGPVAWPAGAVAELAAATGLSESEAVIVLAGIPGGDGSGNDVLGPDALELTKLRRTEAGLARSTVGAVPQADRAALLAALVPADPAALWTTGPDAGAAARVWLERQGAVVRLNPDLTAAVGSDAQNANRLLNPSGVGWLAGPTRQRYGKDGLVADEPARIPRGWDLAGAVRVLERLAYAIPYGDPVRGHALNTLRAIRERLDDPGLILDLDIEWTASFDATSVPLRAALGLPESGGAGADGLVRAGEAFVLAPWGSRGEFTYVRPAGLSDPGSYDLVTAVRGEPAHHLEAVRRLRSDALWHLMAAGTGPDAPSGAAQNPAFSVPGLVAEVAAAHGLGEDAAAVYLMLLALPDPTDRNTARWTGWKPARLRKARAEVLAAGLVVEAKRPRAGRSLFLPGGWHVLRTPALPVESWKEGLYPLTSRVAASVPMPVPDLFRAAWRRVTDGQPPGLEELRTRPGRRRR